MTRPDTEQESPTRLLARDLLWEALAQAWIDLKIQEERSVVSPRKNGRPERWTRDAILTAIRAFVSRTGTVPADPEFRQAAQHGLPARISVRKCWPSIGEAIRAAGFVPVPSRRGSNLRMRRRLTHQAHLY